jgi:hypothetical protein
MLNNEVLNIPVGTAVVVMDSNQYARKRYEDEVHQIDPSRTKTGVKYSNTRYEALKQGNRDWSEDPADFTPAQEGDRTAGFLVEFVSSGASGIKYYMVVKPRGFVSTLADYDAVWAGIIAQRQVEAEARAKAQEIAQRREQQRRTIRDGVLAQQKVMQDSLKETLVSTIKSVLGRYEEHWLDISFSTDGSWENEDSDAPIFNAVQTGYVRLSYKDFQRLLEKAIQE